MSAPKAPSGRASFKKKDGIISISSDWTLVLWTPLPGDGPPTIKLPVKNINNLQKTSEASPKVILKLLEKNPDGGDPIPYSFNFNGPDARPEMKALTDALSNLISAIKAGSSEVPQLAPPNGDATPGGTTGLSGSMTFAASANSQPQTANWFNDSQLLGDITLQIEYLKSNETLNQTYMEAKATKPDSISLGAFNTQFWSTRTHLLRAFMIERSQEKADYNVLSTIKPEKTEEGQLKLTLGAPQIALIFKQHPLILRIYNENVPKLSETAFWERFFLSKLSKKLKGERITDADRDDPVFDKYDPRDNLTGFAAKITLQNVPHVIDVEANEENQGGFKGGNRPDKEMRPRKGAEVPILKTLNSLSAKLMANVAASDLDPHAPRGIDEDTYNQLALRDLQDDDEAERIRLQVRDQTAFFSKGESISTNSDVYAKQDPRKALSLFQNWNKTLNIQAHKPVGMDLHAGIGIDDNSDSSDSDAGIGGGASGGGAPSKPKSDHVGSRLARRTAQKYVLDGVRTHRSQDYGTDTNPDSPMGLPKDRARQCTITHATTVEFLHQFWAAFLSGNPDRAAELQYLNDALAKSVERIHAVADEAERERDAIIAQKKRDIREYYERTKKKIRWKADSVGGGKAAVMKMMRPALDAIAKAQAEYRKALAAEGVAPSMED